MFSVGILARDSSLLSTNFFLFFLPSLFYLFLSSLLPCCSLPTFPLLHSFSFSSFPFCCLLVSSPSSPSSSYHTTCCSSAFHRALVTTTTPLGLSQRGGAFTSFTDSRMDEILSTFPPFRRDSDEIWEESRRRGDGWLVGGKVPVLAERDEACGDK